MTNKYSGLGIVKSVKKSGFGCPQVHIINIGTTIRTFFFPRKASYIIMEMI